MNDVAELNLCIDAIEKLMSDAVKDTSGKYKLIDCPLKHTFTPGLYSREIFMPAGILVTSEIHKTQHQFVISQGVVTVALMENGKVISEETHEAPYQGVTKPGTKRLLYIHEDCIWTTFHSTLLTTVDDIYNDIIEKHENPLLSGHYKNNIFISDQNLIENTK